MIEHSPSPDVDSRAVREYLAVLDDAAFGAATPLLRRNPAPADPAARWTCAHHPPAFHAYSTNYLIDLDHAVIMDVEASIGCGRPTAPRASA
ncbi:hypothetical protein FHT02_003304 [Sphingomonas xinjiangensis]|uniref:Uncharacterized protein n=1 Tax=Sphingomonas xinjiangensis TaxID=643568 RepID=A0A840YL76_9SPHN|nr:hypothetical protein [Sphingomonas xinjiangensis]